MRIRSIHHSRRATSPDRRRRVFLRSLCGHLKEGATALEHAAAASFAHRRHHDDVSQASRGCRIGQASLPCVPTEGRALEQNATVDIVWKKDGWRFGHPTGMGDLRDFGQNLRAGVSAADDQDPAVCVGLRPHIVRGVNLRALEPLSSRIGGNVGRGPGSCCADHRPRLDDPLIAMNLHAGAGTGG